MLKPYRHKCMQVAGMYSRIWALDGLHMNSPQNTGRPCPLIVPQRLPILLFLQQHACVCRCSAIGRSIWPQRIRGGAREMFASSGTTIPPPLSPCALSQCDPIPLSTCTRMHPHPFSSESCALPPQPLMSPCAHMHHHPISLHPRTSGSQLGKGTPMTPTGFTFNRSNTTRTPWPSPSPSLKRLPPVGNGAWAAPEIASSKFTWQAVQHTCEEFL